MKCGRWGSEVFGFGTRRTGGTDHDWQTVKTGWPLYDHATGR